MRRSKTRVSRQKVRERAEQGVRLERAGSVEVRTTTSEIALKRAKAKARIRRCPLRGRHGGQVRGLDLRRLSGERGCPEERVEAKVRRAKVEKEKVAKAKAAKAGRVMAWRSTEARAMLANTRTITLAITPVTSLSLHAIWACWETST